MLSATDRASRPSSIVLCIFLDGLLMGVSAAEVCEPPEACRPIILVPGVMGSRLREHVRTGNSVETVTHNLWMPSSHRLVTRAAAMGPLSAAGYQEWTTTLDPKVPHPHQGRIEPDFRNWGLKGVSCLLKVGRECVASAKIFWDMIVHLERSGYRAGSNLYGVPFDWRFPPTENHLCADLARTLHHITNMTTHRKALVVSHSLGNLQIVHCMQRVFGPETTSKIRALVSIAAPYAGSPKVARVVLSGAEMVSRMIISDAETRDFSRRMGSTYMLLPDERVFGNSTILTLRGGESQNGATTLPGYGGASSASPLPGGVNVPGGVNDGVERIRGTRRELRALMDKIEAHAVGDGRTGMLKAYEKALDVVDIWQAPPVPVVCIIGVGMPTPVSFEYLEPWPKNMNEDPCITKMEDGDSTVPVRSAEDVCQAWAQQRRCHAPLSTIHPLGFKGRTEECVDTVYLHCRASNMEAVDYPRGQDQCAEFHARILQKLPTLDLIQSLAVNPRAYEPRYSQDIEQVHELNQLVAWLHNSAVRRLPTAALVRGLLSTWLASPAARQRSPPAEISSALHQLPVLWDTLGSRLAYERVLAALQALNAAAAAAPLQAATHHHSAASSSTPGDETPPSAREAASGSLSSAWKQPDGRAPDERVPGAPHSISTDASSSTAPSAANGAASLAAASGGDTVEVGAVGAGWGWPPSPPSPPATFGGSSASAEEHGTRALREAGMRAAIDRVGHAWKAIRDSSERVDTYLSGVSRRCTAKLPRASSAIPSQSIPSQPIPSRGSAECAARTTHHPSMPSSADGRTGDAGVAGGGMASASSISASSISASSISAVGRGPHGDDYSREGYSTEGGQEWYQEDTMIGSLGLPDHCPYTYERASHASLQARGTRPMHTHTHTCTCTCTYAHTHTHTHTHMRIPACRRVSGPLG